MQYFLIVLSALGRVIPHPSNFAPSGAIGLFAGANMPLSKAVFVPIVPMVIADMFVGFYDWRVLLFVYIGMLLSVFVGRYMIAGREKVLNIAGGVGVNAVLFFLFSNFGVWVAGFYGYTFAGLIECYIMGLPYLGYSLIGDSFYATVLFGGKALFKQYTGSASSSTAAV